MHDYLYKAVDADGRIRSARLRTRDLDDLERILLRQGARLIHARPARRFERFADAIRPVRRRALIGFCFHLEQLLAAGIPLLDALLDAGRHGDRGGLRRVARALADDIGSGLSFSGALAQHPSVFDRVFVGLIRAGEASGRVPEALRDLGGMLRERDELAAQTVRILLYPAFAATAVSGALLFLMWQVVPQLLAFVQGMQETLPLHTRLLVALCEGLRRYAPFALPLPPLFAIGVGLAVRRSAAARYRFDRLKLALWLFGPILRKLALARVAGCCAALYGAGVAFLDCLTFAEAVAGNEVVARALRRAGEAVRGGRGIAASFEREPVFPAMMVRMLGVGEATGNIDRALSNVAYFYRRDAGERIARLHALLEPCLTVFLGVMLGWVMLSVLGPVYDLIGRMGL